MKRSLFKFNVLLQCCQPAIILLENFLVAKSLVPVLYLICARFIDEKENMVSEAPISIILTLLEFASCAFALFVIICEILFSI